MLVDLDVVGARRDNFVVPALNKSEGTLSNHCLLMLPMEITAINTIESQLVDRRSHVDFIPGFRISI